METIWRAFMGGTLAMVLALAVSAPPAQSATVLYVDDTPSNNGAVSCPPSPPAFTDLQSAVASLGATTSNVTINVCPGRYGTPTNAVTFLGFHSLKVIGLGGALIDADGFTGAVISVADSTNVTVSGLTISGAANLGGAATAIQYVNSTGTIKNDLVTDWHQDFSAPLTANDYGIVTVTTDPTKTVTITQNTVFDVQDNGIMAVGPASAAISKNRVVLHSDIDPFQYFNPGPKEQAGVMLLGAGAGSTVAGNVIESNAGMEPYPCVTPCLLADVFSRGVFLVQTSQATVSGNKISFLGSGVAVESWCYTGLAAGADQNVVSKNKLYNNRAGFSSHVQDYYGTSCNPHANGNVVKGNRFDRNYQGAIFGAFLLADTPAAITGDQLTGNTFTGYPTTPFDLTIATTGNNVTGLVTSPNTIKAMALTGPLP